MAAELAGDLVLRTQDRTGVPTIFNALTSAPRVTERLVGASTLELFLTDTSGKLLTQLGNKVWASSRGRNFELVGFKRRDHRLSLLLEDSLIAALRRRTDSLSIPAASTSAPELVQRLAVEAEVPHRIDPTPRPVTWTVHRNIGDVGSSNSWKVLGDIATRTGQRRFSDGDALVVGPDAWLLSSAATTVRELDGTIGRLNAHLDTGLDYQSATTQVSTQSWVQRPGSVVDVQDLGVLSGRWLVSVVATVADAETSDLTLIRPTSPPSVLGPAPTAVVGSEPGNPDWIELGGDPGSGTTGHPARDRMIGWALARVGSTYQLGGIGPTYDASGFIQAATRAGGVDRVLTRPGIKQWDTVVAAGATIPVSVALTTRGALLFGQNGAVAISLGNGSTVEAHGPAHGVAVLGSARFRVWKGGALWI